ncbi:hypothetical protein [Tsukamurella paurometabola]|uniref:Uncharacterized protein n=1 Tax=Tsukamurella paurometabola TaxID=2061 RepID=A0ABS5NEQ9_TSUPA|nr:hypothetical protein [Tsukamurella paurometabola]MBS4102785.1 hypothetical protein [Tsukamurella paurometabola]
MDDVSEVEANLLARPDIMSQIEVNRAGGPARRGRPARRPHMDAARDGNG